MRLFLFAVVLALVLPALARAVSVSAAFPASGSALTEGTVTVGWRLDVADCDPTKNAVTSVEVWRGSEVVVGAGTLPEPPESGFNAGLFANAHKPFVLSFPALAKLDGSAESYRWRGLLICGQFGFGPGYEVAGPWSEFTVTRSGGSPNPTPPTPPPAAPPPPAPTQPELTPADCRLLGIWKTLRRHGGRWSRKDVTVALERLERLQPASPEAKQAKRAFIKYVEGYGSLRAEGWVALDRAYELGGHQNPAVVRGGQSPEPFFQEAERLFAQASRFLRDNLDVEAGVFRLARACNPTLPVERLGDPESIVFGPETKARLERLRGRALDAAEVMKWAGVACNLTNINKLWGPTRDPEIVMVRVQASSDVLEAGGQIPDGPPPVPGEYCKLVTKALQGYAQAGALLYQLLASDPPDPSYTSLVSVTSARALQIPDSATEVNSRLNDLLLNLGAQLAVGRGLLVSIERAQGAALAGDPTWRLRQHARAGQYARWLARLLIDEAAMRDALAAGWKQEGVRATKGRPERLTPAGQRRLARELNPLIRGLGNDPRDLPYLAAISPKRPAPRSARLPAAIASTHHRRDLLAAAAALNSYADAAPAETNA